MLALFLADYVSIWAIYAIQRMPNKILTVPVSSSSEWGRLSQCYFDTEQNFWAKRLFKMAT